MLLARHHQLGELLLLGRRLLGRRRRGRGALLALGARHRHARRLGGDLSPVLRRLVVVLLVLVLVLLVLLVLLARVVVVVVVGAALHGVAHVVLADTGVVGGARLHGAAQPLRRHVALRAVEERREVRRALLARLVRMRRQQRARVDAVEEPLRLHVLAPRLHPLRRHRPVDNLVRDRGGAAREGRALALPPELAAAAQHHKLERRHGALAAAEEDALAEETRQAGELGGRRIVEHLLQSCVLLLATALGAVAVLGAVGRRGRGRAVGAAILHAL